MISCWITFLIAWPVLVRSYGSLDTKRTVGVLLRIAIAVVISWAATVALAEFVPDLLWTVGESRGAALISLVATSALIAAVYVVSTWLLRISETRELLGWISGVLRRRR